MVPPPDTPEGLVLVAALIIGIGYALLLIADATTLATDASEWVGIPLLLGTVAIFALAGRMGEESGRVRSTELELARTVALREESVQPPNPDSALARVMKEHLRASAQTRCAVRSHAYAAGPALWGTLLALAAAVSWGIGWATGTTWPGYLAVVLELPAFVLLVLAVAVLGLGVGAARKVDGFERLSPRRWRQFDLRAPAIAEAVQAYGWLSEFDRTLWNDAGLGLPGAPATA